MSGNGGQKNLEELKKFVHKIVTWKLAPPTPSNLAVGKKDSFPPTLFLAVIPTNITGKVPPLLTSNVPK